MKYVNLLTHAVARERVDFAIAKLSNGHKQSAHPCLLHYLPGSNLISHNVRRMADVESTFFSCGSRPNFGDGLGLRYIAAVETDGAMHEWRTWHPQRRWSKPEGILMAVSGGRCFDSVSFYAAGSAFRTCEEATQKTWVRRPFRRLIPNAPGFPRRPYPIRLTELCCEGQCALFAQPSYCGAAARDSGRTWVSSSRVRGNRSMVSEEEVARLLMHDKKTGSRLIVRSVQSPVSAP